MTDLELNLADGESADDRSSSPDVRNPLLKLAGAGAFATLPDKDRRELRALLDELRRDARAVSDELHLRKKLRTAAYWRACSVYAGHTARVVCARSAPRAVIDRPKAPSAGLASNPLLGRPSAQAIRAVSPAVRAALRQLLAELRLDAIQNSHKSWEKSKSPMSVYWADVSTFVGITARFLRDPVAAAIAAPDPVARQASAFSPWKDSARRDGLPARCPV